MSGSGSGSVTKSEGGICFEWISSGAYDKILEGHYTHRGEEEEDRSLTEDVSEAAVHYARSAKETVKDMADAAKKAAQAFSDAFKEQERKN